MKVAVIGAGASGLSTIKCCLDEGLEVECFEQGQDIGGLWRYSEHEGHSSVYESTIINTSKELTCFSDFPMPKEFAPFLPHHMMLRYYVLYVARFGLCNYIRFNCKVVSVQRSKDHETTSKWVVIYQQEYDGSVTKEKRCEFDAVFVCTGHLWKPRLPSYPGIGDFKGLILHSHSYKNPKGFENKTVLIIGKLKC
jgi:dimethylaniline monooxygenase (N-oxide forming)